MIVEVARIDVLELRAPVSPSQAALLRQGQPATIETEAQPGLRFVGKVTAVGSVVDPLTGAAPVRIRVVNEQGALRANVVGRGRVVVDVHKGALLVPKAAVVAGPDGPGLEVVEDGKAKRVAVTTGYDDGERVEVLTGVAESQPIIVQGAYAIPDDTRVQAQPEGADAGSSETGSLPAREPQ
jgi:membrane fusion protein (multidrug efflux system)